MHDRSFLWRVGKRRSVIGEIAWDWGLFGLGGYISFDDDLDDWQWTLILHLAFLFVRVQWCYDKLDWEAIDGK